jgi:hypothetical protein
VGCAAMKLTVRTRKWRDAPHAAAARPEPEEVPHAGWQAHARSRLYSVCQKAASAAHGSALY